MAVRWELEEDGTLLHVVTGEHFGTSDLLEAGRAALADPRAKPPLRLLFDNRDSKENASHDDLRSRGMQMTRGRERFVSRIAVVVSDDLHRGLARVGGAYAASSGFEVEVFEDIDAARAWLLRSAAGK
jgi:hypothetical protein